MCMCACVHMCMHACVRACMHSDISYNQELPVIEVLTNKSLFLCPCSDFRKAAHLCHTEDLQHVEEYSRLIHMQNRIEVSTISVGVAERPGYGQRSLCNPWMDAISCSCKY